MTLPSLKKLVLSVHFFLLLGLLVITCLPLSWPISLPPQFWIKQGINYFLWAGVFYLNLNVFVPRILYKSKSFLFAVLVTCSLVIMVLLNRLISALLNLPVMMEKIFAKQRAHINFQNDPVVDFSIIIITLVVFGVGIIIAVVQKIQQDQLKVQNSEKEKISSELAFLKAQINPHFFFNILHTIHALTETDTRSAGDSIYTLSHMMRYVLYDTKNDETTLEKEVNFVEDYIKLMQLRLTDQVQIIFDKPNNLRNVKVAPMLFLPFIENAFKHGISSIHPCYIYIGIKQIGRTLNIEVRNSIFIEKAENLEESNGIGLINTQRRLDLIYPGKHQLKVESNQVANEFTVQLNLTL